MIGKVCMSGNTWEVHLCLIIERCLFIFCNSSFTCGFLAFIHKDISLSLAADTACCATLNSTSLLSSIVWKSVASSTPKASGNYTVCRHGVRL